MAELPPEMLGEISNLPGLLSKRGPLSSFSTMDEDTRRYILSKVLGESSPLIEEIFKLSTESTQATLLDQVYAYELPPSTKLTDFEVAEILSKIFNL